MKGIETRARAFILKGIALLGIILWTSVIKADSEAKGKVIYLNQERKENSTIFNGDELLSPGDKIAKSFFISNNNGFTASVNNIKIKGALNDSYGKNVDKDSAGYRDFLNNSSIASYCKGKD